MNRETKKRTKTLKYVFGGRAGIRAGGPELGGRRTRKAFFLGLHTMAAGSRPGSIDCAARWRGNEYTVVSDVLDVRMKR